MVSIVTMSGHNAADTLMFALGDAIDVSVKCGATAIAHIHQWTVDTLHQAREHSINKNSESDENYVIIDSGKGGKLPIEKGTTRV